VTINSEGGSYMTFFIPVGLFCVVGTVLYVLLFTRPHRRVPPYRSMASAQSGGTAAPGLASFAGGATVEVSPYEREQPPAAAPDGPGNVSGEAASAAPDQAPASDAPGGEAGSPQQAAATESTEAGE
jgi:hypothetical protein